MDLVGNWWTKIRATSVGFGSWHLRWCFTCWVRGDSLYIYINTYMMSGDEWTSFYHESQIWDSVLWIFIVWIFINWQSLLWGTGLLGEQLRDSAPRSFIEGLDLSSAMLQQASGSCLGWFKFETFKRFSIGNADEMVKFNLTANIANLARFEFRAVNFKDIIWKSVLQRDSNTRVCGCMYLWIAADATHQ